MSELMRALEFVSRQLINYYQITKASLSDHLDNLKRHSQGCEKQALNNAAKSKILYPWTGYLGYILTRDLAGNVFFWNVFPSLHLQTCLVSRRHVGDMSLVMSQTQENVVSARVSKRHDIWRHVATCLQDMSSNVCNNVIAFRAQTQKLYGRVANSYVWADLYLSAVIDINWVCRGFFFHVLCRGDMPFLA